MSGRHGRDNRDGYDSHSAIEREATNTAHLITGLGWRLLQNQEVLEHPQVLSALRNLAELLPYTDESPGRHRCAADNGLDQQISDAFGDNLKPSPVAATTSTEFMDALRQYRAWSGDPSWRVIKKRSGHVFVHSTMWNAMNGDTLPKLEVVQAIVIGCGGGEEDLSSFVQAWRRIALSRARERSAAARFNE